MLVDRLQENLLTKEEDWDVPRIEVSIHEILTDPDHPMDLGSLPADEAIERIRRLYGFLPAIEDVSLAGGIATITITEDSPYRVDEARQTSRRGARAAERGNYQAAKEMKVPNFLAHLVEGER